MSFRPLDQSVPHLPTESDGTAPASFEVGDQVAKTGGRYGGPGEVVGVTPAFDGDHVLYLVAHRIEGGFGRFVHVYPATALSLATPKGKSR